MSLENNQPVVFKLIVALLIIYLLIYFISLPTRRPNEDEAILAEHSYTLLREGVVKSYMFEGMGLGWEQKQYHYHKLFIFLGALFVEPLNIVNLRAISFFFAFVFFSFIF